MPPSFRSEASRLVALAAFLVVVAACGAESHTLSCVVKVGGAQTTVSLNTKVGSSVMATVPSYTVTFSILDGPRLTANVQDAHFKTLMRTTSGADGGGGGSVTTPDGLLEYSCTPQGA